MAKPLARWITAGACLALLAGAWVLSSQPRIPWSNSTNMAVSPRHPITPQMREGAKAQQGSQAPVIALTSSEGEKINTEELLKKGPVVVVMTKDGCPCSIESQPFFNAIHNLYKDKATFVGVIDAGIPVAQLYVRAHSVPYPLLSEPTPKTFQAFGAKQSVYIYLVGKDGVVKRVWPGYSAPMLIELNAAVAEAAGVPAKPLTITGAPSEMTSGCYFFKDDPTVSSS